MYIKGKNRGRILPLPTHPKKLHKPYRIRHAGLLAAGIMLIILAAFYTGYLIGSNDVVVVTTANNDDLPKSRSESSLKSVKSDSGFSFTYDSSIFKTDPSVPDDNSTPANEVILSPRPSVVKGSEAISRFKIHSDEDRTALNNFAKKNRLKEDNEALTSYFAPSADTDFSVETLNQTQEKLGSLNLQKTVYLKKPRQNAGMKPIYAIVWTAFNQDRPLSITIDSLIDENIPSIYGDVLNTLQFGDNTSNQVLAANDSKEKSFDVNNISPATVKIYHFVCGVLVIDGTAQGENTCDGSVGSGFLVSGDGVIATSGHVVVLSAADILVTELLNNPSLLQQFAIAGGLNESQRNQQSAIASVLARLYDLPPEKLSLQSKQETTYVALGNRPLNPKTPDEIRKIMSMSDNDFVKKADVLAVNYQAKDLLVIEQQGEQGFSASDVALLKINASNTPFIALRENDIQQNAPINLIGFPADADNQLTSNDVISPSITSGTISSIRKANGSNALLFQTDADASEGSSGGPAIDENGKVFGIVTYRFKSNSETDAAKSYVRDISDFKDLLKAEEISLSVKSPTQRNWEEGLELYKEDRYSKALVKFQKVQAEYPAHRLVDSYISGAKQAIRDGKEKKEPPYGLIAAGITAVAGIFITYVSIRIIIRHKKAHNEYKKDHLDNQNIVSPPM